MSDSLQWWLVLQLVGIVGLPLCLALFSRLPDRGYALSKPLALLFLTYVFWLLNSLHILPNSPAGILGALAFIALVSGAFAWRNRDDLREWATRFWPYIVGVEVLLLVTFILAAWLRTFVGDISGTEQPMDLMFVNAATRAGNFPPEDPWLSGYDVAYYYGGYLVVAIVGQMANVPTDIAYNLGIAMIAALALTGAFGLVYNLIHIREASDAPGAAASSPANVLRNWKAPVFGLLSAFMLVLMGNLVFVFHYLSSFGLGGQSFYDKLNVEALTANEPKEFVFGWPYPSDFFAFFNPSRIYPLSSTERVITEFPAFSFLLGDLHPHVMSLPFVLIAASAALALYRSREPLDITFWLQRPLGLLATAIILGALAFINTWDIATLSFLIVAAAFISNYGRVRALTTDLFVQVISFAAPLVVLAAILYLPFFLGFSSQADGVVAVVTTPGTTVPGTSPVHLLLFWGPLLAVVVPFCIARIMAARERITTGTIALALLPPVFVVAGWVFAYTLLQAGASDWFLVGRFLGDVSLEGADGFAGQIANRGSAWLSCLFLAACLSVAVLALWLEVTADDATGERESVRFSLLLAATAFLLILGTEFFYVDDVFHSRMNTVFKLYYQAWLLLAVSGGFTLYYLASRWRFSFRRESAFRGIWAAAAAVLLLGAALYPLGAIPNRTQGFDAPRTLHGLQFLPRDERAAIDWLNERSQGQEFVIAEAVGGDYQINGRISASTGMPTVLGWAGHEDQWRGDGGAARAGRFEDVNALYSTADDASIAGIVEKYGVTFIYVGVVERDTYGPAVADRFASMTVAYQSETCNNPDPADDRDCVTIFSARSRSTGEVQSNP